MERPLTCEDRDRPRTELDNAVLMSLGRILIDAVNPGLGHCQSSADFIEVPLFERDLFRRPKSGEEAKLMKVPLYLALGSRSRFGLEQIPWRVLSFSGDTFRGVCLFAPSTPAIQIFIPTMRAFDRSQLIIEIRRRFAAGCCGRSRNYEPARSILTRPPHIDLARYHLLRWPNIDMAQRGSGDRFVRRRTLTF
jgi:hypothetical protein